MSEEQKKVDKIFYEKLEVSEIFQRNSKVFQFFKGDILLSVFVFFVPLAVILSIAFQDILNINLLKIDQKSAQRLMAFTLILQVAYTFFFSGLILFVKHFFEKKIFHKTIFLKSLFNRLFLFLLNFALFYFLVFTAFVLLSAVVTSIAVPNLVLLIITLALMLCLRAFFYFAYFLTFDEGISGILAFKESFKIFKATPLRIFVFSTITFLAELAIPIIFNYLSSLITWHRLEFKFLTVQICSALFLIIPAVLFSVVYYNLRQISKPKDSNPEESQNNLPSQA